MAENKIVMYQTEDGQTQIDVRLENDTVWLTQAQMAALFDKTPQNITMHIRNAYNEGDLEKSTTCKEYLQVQTEGHRTVKRMNQSEQLNRNLYMITIRKYRTQDMVSAMRIWNEVVRDGIAFPQDEELTEQNTGNFFKSQSYTGVAEDCETGELVGLYILHPNNVGRCGHICNTSYAVKSDKRGLHIGEQLVKDSLKVGAELGFRILQFNAVVATNSHALHLYERMGFTQLGRIPQGFRMKDGHYEDIIPHYIPLK